MQVRLLAIEFRDLMTSGLLGHGFDKCLRVPMLRMRRLIMKKRITAIAAGFGIFPVVLIAGMRLLAHPAQDYAYYGRPGFRIIAHRGGPGLGPENTMETFRRSLAAGADTLDMDIRVTRDNQLIIMHDATVDRTTDGTGTVRGMDLRDIKKLNAGPRRPPGGRDSSVRDLKITVPTVAEVLEAFPETPLVMEIKDEKPGTGKILCGLLARYRKTDSVLVASMHSAMLSEFRRVCPQVATSAGPRTVLAFYLLNKMGLTSLFTAGTAAFQVPIAVRDRRIATPEFVSAAHRRNIKVEVWTVNDASTMQRLIDAGVDGIFTDFPDRLKSVVDGALRPRGNKKSLPVRKGLFVHENSG